MKTILALILLAAPGLEAQDDVEAKKKRLGEILRQAQKLQVEGEQLLKELSGGDATKIQSILKEVAEKYAPEFGAEMEKGALASNERNASVTLKTLATAEADFRANDRDENHVNDYWVADISGLYRVDPGAAIKLIELATATADARPCVPLDKADTFPGAPKQHASRLIKVEKPSPKAGYWFAAIEKYVD